MDDEGLQSKGIKGQRLTVADLIQEFIGAVIVAFPVALTEEVWRLADKLSMLHVLLIFFGAMAVVYVFIKHSELQDWEHQNVGGFIPLRLLSSVVISLITASSILLLLGIYPLILDNLIWFLKTSLILGVFCLIGSLGVDMIR
jgi:uncharacterized membrane protein